MDNIVREAAERCVKVGAKLLVVDTLGQFCGLKGDSENESGTALEILRPLKEVASKTKVAIIVVRHDRKSGGDVGQAGRGSTAFAGAVDQLISVRRPEGNMRETLRVLICSGRAKMPNELVVDRLPSGVYDALGDSAQVALDEAKSAVVMNLPEEADAAITLEELIENIETASRSTVQRVLKEFREQGRVHRTGEGKKGNPYRFWFDGRHDA